MIANANSNSGAPEGAAVAAPMKPCSRILVVEDDVDIRCLNTEVLKSSGYEVVAAEDGVAAWEALLSKSFNLVVTDDEMPRLSGVGLVRKLRAAHMALPVIMATGTLPKQEFTKFPWLQPDATLHKPYTIEELLGTVKAVLRGSNAAREEMAAPSNWPSRSPGDGWLL